MAKNRGKKISMIKKNQEQSVGIETTEGLIGWLIVF
ncbi:Uncharacterised protein [Streptococcus pneumoniae]|nr:Uncharacterised protein [Streptococcus pneumoniae]